MLTIFLAAATLSQMFGCRDSELPSGVIDSEQLAEVYVALVRNEGMLERWRTFDTGKFDPDTVLSGLGVTQEQIEETIRYYNRDVRRWKNFYADVVKIQEGEQQK